MLQLHVNIHVHSLTDAVGKRLSHNWPARSHEWLSKTTLRTTSPLTTLWWPICYTCINALHQPSDHPHLTSFVSSWLSQKPHNTLRKATNFHLRVSTQQLLMHRITWELTRTLATPTGHTQCRDQFTFSSDSWVWQLLSIKTKIFIIIFLNTFKHILLLSCSAVSFTLHCCSSSLFSYHSLLSPFLS